MRNISVMSSLILVLSILGSIIGYIIIAVHFDRIWFEFMPILWLCVVTFAGAVGIVIAAFLNDNKKNRT